MISVVLNPQFELEYLFPLLDLLLVYFQCICRTRWKHFKDYKKELITLSLLIINALKEDFRL